MPKYTIHTLKTGVFSGTLNSTKLTEVLNQYGAQGWKLNRIVHEQKRAWFLFTREALFVIFERQD